MCQKSLFKLIFSALLFVGVASSAMGQPLWRTAVTVTTQDADTITFSVNHPTGIREASFSYGFAAGMMLTYHFTCVPTITIRVEKKRTEPNGSEAPLTNVNITDCEDLVGPGRDDFDTAFVVGDDFSVGPGTPFAARPLVPRDLAPPDRMRAILGWWVFVWWWWVFIGPLVTIGLLVLILLRLRRN